MGDEPLRCPDCSAGFEPDDNYCRNCGMFLPASRSLTVARETALMEPPPRAGLPAPVKRAATAMALGAALQIGVGLAGKYLIRQATKQAVSATRQPGSGSGRRPRTPIRPSRAVSRSSVPDDVVSVHETVMVHRAWIRRG